MSERADERCGTATRPRSTGNVLESASERQSIRSGLEAGLSALGLDASPSAVERWLILTELLDGWGRRMNLTGHRGKAAIAHRLLLEAAALSQVLPPARSVADLGSGAGIPGLPLALCRPDCHVVLVEARERRHHFQRAAIRALALENVDARRGRVEEIEAQACDGVISQAFAKPFQAFAWMLPWSMPGGWLAIATQPGSELGELTHQALDTSTLVLYRAPSWAPERPTALAARSSPASRSDPSGRSPERAVWIAHRTANELDHLPN